MARPVHLQRRRIRRFGKGKVGNGVVRLLRDAGAYDDDGKWVDMPETPRDIRANTQPFVSAKDSGRARELVEAGVQLDAARLFWTEEPLQPVVPADENGDGGSAGDVLVWDNQRWRIRSTLRWSYYSESIGVREECQ